MKKQERIYKFITWNIKKIKCSGKGTISSKEFDRLCCDTFNYFKLGRINITKKEKIQTIEAIISGYRWQVVRENDKVSFQWPFPSRAVTIAKSISSGISIIKKIREYNK